jgi:3D (Asp-Asp-Asp) domain-containing protein
MGKRTALWIAAAAIVLSMGSRFAAVAGEPTIDSFGRLWGAKTLASELPTMADGSSKALASSDAMAWAPVLATTPTVADTRKVSVWATAYSSDPTQTDETPFVTASGATVHDGVAAANFLPLGTNFVIPELFGDKTFTVEDRMNKKYDGMHTIDLWFSDTQKAIDFGRRAAVIVITK